jgi:integrase
MQTVSDPLEVFTARLLRRSGSQQTVISYRFMLLWFLKWLGLSPAQLIEKVESGQILVEDLINDWLDHQQTLGHSPQTMRVSFFAVKKFLQVSLPRHTFFWDSVELPKIRNVEPDRIPSKSELLRILNHADLKDRVIVTLAVSSGIRESALAGLKIRDVDLVSYPDVGAISVPGPLNKAKFPYVSFITPQARTLPHGTQEIQDRHKLGTVSYPGRNLSGSPTCQRRHPRTHARGRLLVGSYAYVGGFA